MRIRSTYFSVLALVAILAATLLGAAAAAAETPVGLIPVKSAPLLDTRVGIGAPRGPVYAWTHVLTATSGAAGLPASGVRAIALTVTVGEPTADGHLSVYSASTTEPLTPTVTFTRNTGTSTSIVVPLGAGGRVIFYNASPGTVRLTANVTGYYLAGIPGQPTQVRAFGQKVNEGAISVSFTVPVISGANPRAVYTLHDLTEPTLPDLIVSRPVVAAAGATQTQLITPADGVKTHLYSVSVAVQTDSGTGLASSRTTVSGSPCGDFDYYRGFDLVGVAKGPLNTFTLTVDPQGGARTTLTMRSTGGTRTFTVVGPKVTTFGPIVDNVGYNPNGTQIDPIHIDATNDCGTFSTFIEFPSFQRPTLAVTGTQNTITLTASNLLPDSNITFNCNAAPAYLYKDYGVTESTFTARSNADGVVVVGPPKTCRLSIPSGFPSDNDFVGWIALGGRPQYNDAFYSNAIPLS